MARYDARVVLILAPPGAGAIHLIAWKLFLFQPRQALVHGIKRRT